MAVRWSSENVVAEHRELQANAMALNWRGEYALLAGRRTLALIALDKPSEVVKRVSRTQQKYDVTAAEWNPMQAQGHTFVLASGERAEICQWSEGSLNCITSLKAHTRTITDLNWHRSDPHLLATCSIDTFVHIWDTRETRKPVASLSSIAGASQVKWNKLNQNFLASGHDSDIRVWDNRKINQPTQYIAAHLSKIQGLDWSPNHENQLVTSSNDCTVKFFDITNPRKAENFINTLSPVWRARYTPFGEGVVTVVVPQLRRGENSLLLWSVNDVSSPVHTFVGHSDVVLEFEWQQGPSSPGIHHLVTWARDHSLRIWKIDQQLQKLCGHDTEEETILGESTDSDFATEAHLTQVDAEEEFDRESEDIPRKSGVEESVSESVEASVSGDLHLSQASSAHSYTLDGLPESSENTEKAAPESLPDSSSTLDKVMNEDLAESSEMTKKNSQESVPDLSEVTDKDQHETSVKAESTTEICDTQVMIGEGAAATQLQNNKNLQPDNSTLISQPGSDLLSSKPLSAQPDAIGTGPASAVPMGSSAATQPMSLQQEFSLLNTSQDSTQVNSVEVVAGGYEVQDGGGCSTDSRDADVRDGKSNQEIHADCDGCEQHQADGHQSTFNNAAKELPTVLCDVGGLMRCQLNVMNKTSKCFTLDGTDFTDSVKPEAFLKPELSNKQNQNKMPKTVISLESSSGMQSLTENYLEEFGNSATDASLLSKGIFESDSQIVKMESLDNNYQTENLISEKIAVSTGDDNVMNIKVFSKHSSVSAVEQVDEASHSVVGSQSGLLVCPLGDKESKYGLLQPPEISVTSLTSDDAPLERNYINIEDIAVEEEVVIHIDFQSISKDVDSSDCRSCLKDSGSISHDRLIVETGCKNQILVKQPSSSASSLADKQTILNAAVMTGSLILNDASQVQAKLIYIPETGEQSSDFSEEACSALAPQLLENNILAPGENLIILGNQAYLTHVEMLVVEGETLSKISLSPLTKSLETYHQRGANFVIISRDFEYYLEASSSMTVPYVKLTLSSQPGRRTVFQNAPHSDEPGLFQCDKCDKTYRVRSSLNSHKVTHNAEKMYKCDECDKAFHYSTPLQVHKRIHSDERPYKCQSCSATFRARTSLRYHERLHTGERPLPCQVCDQRFKDYTALKRHRQKAHDMKCNVCGEECSTLDAYSNHLWQCHNVLYVDKVLFCEHCGEAQVSQKAYNTHMANHRQAEKDLQGPQKKLADYTHQCGICSMVTQNKPQMITHIQVHAAVKRFQCKYCKCAYMYRFLLAEHVREKHPNEPPWFCQHCDETFETCRKLNSHSCRSLKGEYFCPHCSFQTSYRHRLFKHIIKDHPEDRAPYHCEFCKSSYENPSKLRYHQKREHPDKMLLLTISRETSRQILGDKLCSSAVDVSQIEMTVDDSTITYSIPKHLRNDEVFKERVKFKCYYCESKFPVKHAMTRHILKEHPSEQAYKCLKCNIFFKSNIESKNHNRKYHKYSATGGRDPLRNEKALKKKAQEFEEKLKQGDPQMEKAYKYRCRYCSMLYKCKRPLIVHYNKWHPEEEWDYFPDKPLGSSNVSAPKKRRLMFFDCNFDKNCSRGFDDCKLLLEHLFHAHNVSSEEADRYVKKRVVVENARRGRLPKNVVDIVSRVGRGHKRKVKNLKTLPDSDDEEGIDDPSYQNDEVDTIPPAFSKGNDENDKSIGTESNDLQNYVDKLAVSKKQSTMSVSKKPEQERRKSDDIYSVIDVKKILYRCRRCNLSFPSKSEYRKHSTIYSDVDCREALNMNIKIEPKTEEDGSEEFDDSDNYQLSCEDEDDTSEEDDRIERVKRHKKSKKFSPHIKSEFEPSIKKSLPNLTGVEAIHVTTKDEDRSEDVLKILTISARDGGQPEVHVKVEKIPPEIANPRTQPSCSVKKSKDLLSVTHADIPVKNVSSKTDYSHQIVEEELEEKDDMKPVLPRKRGRPSRESTTGRLQKLWCASCHISFKTRAEFNYHMRFSH